MYYVFFETGNKEFFSHVVDTISSLRVKHIMEMYPTFLGKKEEVDLKLVTQAFEVHSWEISPLNCVLLSKRDSFHCENQKCMKYHIAVFSTDQVDEFARKIAENIASAMARATTAKDRYNIQKIFHHYQMANIQRVEEVRVSDNNNQNHDEYLCQYIKLTNRLQSKADGFVYVRARTDSDYDYFKVHTKLSTVIPCDCFQP